MRRLPSILDPPGFTWRALRTCWLVARLRCPACGLGRMSSGFCSLHRRCGVCGVVFERDPGEVMGGVFVNSTVSALGICALAGWLELYSPVPRGWATPIVVGFAALFPVLFYRHSRAIWIGLLHLTGLVHRDEAADPEPHISPWPSSGPGGGGSPTVPGPQSSSPHVVVTVGSPTKRTP